MPRFLSTARMYADRASSRKHDALKILAGGIAHDFNNVLTAIMGNISLARMDVPSDSQLSQMLKEIEEASLSARDLTRQLENYAQKNEKFEINSSIDNVVNRVLEKHSDISGIKIEVNVYDNILPVRIIESQISEVIGGLLSNACLSMPSGGKITVEIKNVSIGKKDKSGAPAGEYVMILIKDNGCGIFGDNLKNIFDPYFTTRKKARGMGLAVAYSVILNHKGFITVETEEGTGSKFSVYLPASHEETD